MSLGAIAEMWKVVGGVGKGGIVVREGQELSSAQTSQRLATGALVKQIDLVGERLHYSLADGSGPAEGWVSTSISGKVLLVRLDDDVTKVYLQEMQKKYSSGPQHQFGVKTFQDVDTKMKGSVKAADIDTDAPERKPPETAGQQLSPGCMVRISGLLNANYLNGCLAEVEYEVVGSGRWKVKVQLHDGGSEVKAVKAENLTVEKGATVPGRKLTDLEERIAKLSADLEVKVDGAEAEAELHVRRGHLYWKDLQFVQALREFDAAEKLQPAGIATPSLLALHWCVGIGPGPSKLRGHDELRETVSRLLHIRRSTHDEWGASINIFFPGDAEPVPNCDREIHMASAGMRIFDGTCDVDFSPYEKVEIGYRILSSTKLRPKDTPLIVYFHGNGEVCTDYTGWAEIYEKFPCTFLVFDYRGYGWSTGWPTLGCMTKDAELSVRQLPDVLRGHGLPWPWPAPMILHGRSLGGACAASLAAKLPDWFDGLIMDAAGANDREENLRKFYERAGDPVATEEYANGLAKLSTGVRRSLPADAELGQEVFSPIGTCEQVRSFRGQVLVLHGMLDSIVPPANGERNYAAATNAFSREHSVILADHNAMASQNQYWKKQAEFVQSCMKRWSTSRTRGKR